MECRTSAIVMKEVLSLEAFLSTLTTRKLSLLWIPVEAVVYDRPLVREIPECYYFLTQLQTHLAYLCLEDTNALLPQVPCTFYSLCLEFSSWYLLGPLLYSIQIRDHIEPSQKSLLWSTK